MRVVVVPFEDIQWIEAEDNYVLVHTATRFGANDIIQYLVENGADLSAKDRFGRTPLEEAEFEAPKPTIDLLRQLTARTAQQQKKAEKSPE